MSQSPQERDVVRRRDRSLNDEIQREVNEALGELSIEEILDREEAARRQARQAAQAAAAPAAPSAGPGGGSALRRGRVVGIEARSVLIDLGGKSQGIVPLEQFEDRPPKLGDTVELVFDHYDSAEGLVHLSRKGAIAEAAWETLAEGQILEGRVTGVNKGGLELDVNGIRAFMPASQVDLYHVEDVSVHIGQRLRCQVSELDRREKNLIVSRRALLELEKEQKREKFWADIQPDQVREGVVRTIMPYGAFVDLDGADGLLHISDLAYGRVEKVEDVLQTGQKVQVKVLKVDRDARKLSLGLKQLMTDPWTTVATRYQAQMRATGKVTRVVDFGAFVELEPGIEGLIPVSEMSWSRVIHPREIVRTGQVLELLVLAVDPERRRISLSIKQASANPWTGIAGRYVAESTVPVTVRRITDFGAFVELEPGVEGLIHVSQLSDKRIKHPSDVLKVDQQVQARILNVNEEERKIALTLKNPAPSEPAGPPARSAGGEPGSEPGGPPARPQPAPKKKRDRPLKGGLDGGVFGGGLKDLKL